MIGIYGEIKASEIPAGLQKCVA